MFRVGDGSFVNATLIDPFSTTSIREFSTGDNTFATVLDAKMRFEGIFGIPFFER